MKNIGIVRSRCLQGADDALFVQLGEWVPTIRHQPHVMFLLLREPHLREVGKPIVRLAPRWLESEVAIERAAEHTPLVPFLASLRIHQLSGDTIMLSSCTTRVSCRQRIEG